jgi:hypothetical protein
MHSYLFRKSILSYNLASKKEFEEFLDVSECKVVSIQGIISSIIQELMDNISL